MVEMVVGVKKRLFGGGWLIDELLGSGRTRMRTFTSSRPRGRTFASNRRAPAVVLCVMSKPTLVNYIAHFSGHACRTARCGVPGSAPEQRVDPPVVHGGRGGDEQGPPSPRLLHAGRREAARGHGVFTVCVCQGVILL